MLNDSVFKDFEKSIQKLEEVLNLEKTDIVRDSAIKRFELCFDLAWKSLKLRAKTDGIECYSPKDCFKAGFQLKLIGHDENYLKMIEDRNLTVHLYKENYADEDFRAYLKLFKELSSELSAG